MPLISSTSWDGNSAVLRALHRPDLRKAGFPEAQHMLGQVELLGDLADGAVGSAALSMRDLSARKACSQAYSSVGLAIGQMR